MKVQEVTKEVQEKSVYNPTSRLKEKKKHQSIKPFNTS